MTTRTDPRPLVGEPLPLDLLNTRWTDDEGDHDLLALPGGLATWLASVDLAGSVPASRPTLVALRTTRDALAALVDPDLADHDAARAALNDVLGHGRVRRVLTGSGPEDLVETDAPGWRAAWLAADTYLHLLAHPSRIRKCANPQCPLRFYDVSKAGARRWCSMATCGNRSKSRSHYARHHT